MSASVTRGERATQTPARALTGRWIHIVIAMSRLEDNLPRAKITATAVAAASGIKPTPPAAGAYRVNLIDVGTGLAMLIQGHDFTMLYDGGSNDDSRGIEATSGRKGNQSRLLAY